MMEPESTDNPEYPAIDIGGQLRKAREVASLSVDDIASDLRIHVNYIEALEKNNFEILNGPTYVKGYIRNYARLLEIDADPLVEAYQSSVGEERIPVWSGSQQPLHKGSSHRKSMLTGSVIVALALLVLFGIWLLKSGYLDRYQVDTAQAESASEAAPPESSALPETSAADDATQGITPKSEGMTIKEQVQALNPQAAMSAETPKEEAQSASEEPTESTKVESGTENAIILGEDDFIVAPGGEGSDEIIITLTDECWVEIKDATSYQLIHGLLKAGDIKVILGTAPFQVFLGNAKAVQMDFNGVDYDIAAKTRRNGTARFALVNQ